MTEPEQTREPEADPRTDGVGDGGENELDPPTEEDVAAGVEHDEAHRRAALAELGEDDEDDEDELQRVKMRPVEEADGESW